jgi:hypothetical protein
MLDVWEFYDETEHEWYACKIVEAQPNEVTVTIADFGHPNIYEKRVLQNPATQLRASR